MFLLSTLRYWAFNFFYSNYMPMQILHANSYWFKLFFYIFSFLFFCIFYLYYRNYVGFLNRIKSMAGFSILFFVFFFFFGMYALPFLWWKNMRLAHNIAQAAHLLFNHLYISWFMDMIYSISLVIILIFSCSKTISNWTPFFLSTT